MKAVIIAGGKGTRLGLTDVPKPMVRVGEKTLLEHQIALLRRHGLDDVTILSGHLADVIFDYFKDGRDFGVRITHVVEPRALGTAGSVALLRHWLRERFLVLYGDVLMDMDLDRLLAFDAAKESAATLVVHPNNHPYDSDLLDVDDEDTVTAFHPKPRPAGACHRNLVNAGAYVLSAEVFEHVACGPSLDFGRDVLPDLMRRGKRLRAYRTTEYLHDVGTPDRLREVTHDLHSGRIARFNRRNRRPAIFLDRDGVLVELVDNLSRAEDLRLTEGAGRAVAAVNRSEYLAVVATNQPMIAKGFLTPAGLRTIHNKMETLLGHEHAFVDGIYHCPHHPHSGFPGEVRELKGPCACRKPGPGMLLRAAAEMNIDLARSWMVGDQETDLLAGRAAGCRTLHLCGRGPASPHADLAAASLFEGIEQILSQSARPLAA